MFTKLTQIVTARNHSQHLFMQSCMTWICVEFTFAYNKHEIPTSSLHSIRFPSSWILWVTLAVMEIRSAREICSCELICQLFGLPTADKNNKGNILMENKCCWDFVRCIRFGVAVIFSKWIMYRSWRNWYFLSESKGLIENTKLKVTHHLCLLRVWNRFYVRNKRNQFSTKNRQLIR